MAPVAQMQWTDGLFDVAFAEDHPDVILTASGDGGIQLWNIQNPQVNFYIQAKIMFMYFFLFLIQIKLFIFKVPTQIWKEHAKEVVSYIVKKI